MVCLPLRLPQARPLVFMLLLEGEIEFRFMGFFKFHTKADGDVQIYDRNLTYIHLTP